MTILAIEKSTSDFTPLNKGIHLAICNSVVDIGLQETPWGIKEKIWLGFEVPAERIQYTKDGEEIDAPQSIWKPYTKNLHKKSNLRNDLEAWRGKKFTKEELAGFDMTNLVGKPCQLIVVHNESDDRTYANIKSIVEIQQGMEIPPQELPSICFGSEDTDQWKDVPEWLQKKFDARIEPEEKEPATVEAESVDDFENAVIPF